MENKVTSHILKGLVIALALALLDLIAGFGHFKMAAWFKWIPTLFLFLSLIGACILYGMQNKYTISFGDLFAHGFKTTAVVTCITLLYSLLSIYVIFPETRDIALDQARKEMEKNGNLPQESIETGLAITRKYFLVFAMAGALFGTIIVGALASLMGAAVTPKSPQNNNK